MIDIKNAVKRFDKIRALDGVNMHISKGSVYGLVGPNGAGKTTLMNTLCGIYRAEDGELLLEGEPIYENNNAKKRIVYISDDVFYFHNSTVISLKNYYKGIFPNFDEEKFNELAKFFPSINPKASVRRLSKGMKKQVAFWIAISCRPDILVLDEPVDGLDPVMRHNIWQLLLSRISAEKMTVLVSSHNLRELEDVCDHIGIMDHGKIILQESLDDLRERLLKFQVSFENEVNFSPLNINILRKKQTGRVYELIITGDKNEVVSELNKLAPLFIEELPMTLEEIFIYELGEVDDEIKQMLI